MKTPNLLRRSLHALTLSLAALAPLSASADTPTATAQAALGAYLALWTGAPSADTVSLFSDDLVLRYAHSNPELRSEVQGRASALTQIRALARLGTDWQFRDPRVFATLHDNLKFAQVTATGRSTGDGSTVEQTVVLAFELKGAQVVRIVEFANPAIVLASR